MKRFAASGSTRWVILLLALGVAAWWRALGTGFAQDDFRWLLRASEGGPFSPLAPRFLSATLYFRAMFAAFGPNAVAFHGVQLAIHLATGLLLFRTLTLRVPPARAAAAAALFLTSPALFDALHWASAITDVLCAAWLGFAVWLLIEYGREGSPLRAWAAFAAFLLALAAKEVAVGAAPALALLHWRCPDRTARLRAVATVALALAVVVRELTGGRTVAGEPYALAPLAPLLNLPAYVAAAALGGTAANHASDLAWARQLWVQAAGWLLLGAWLWLLATRRPPGAWPAFVWFLGLLAPLLALDRQLHLFYLYCALPGLAMSLALAGGPGPLRSPSWLKWLVIGGVAFQLAGIEARAIARLPTAPLPTDFVLRRALIADNAIADLTRQRPALESRVVMLGQQPVETESDGRVAAATDYLRDPWWDENVRAALSDGEALRVLFPEVKEVVFKRWLDPGDSSSAIAGYEIDGHLRLADYHTFLGVPRHVASASVTERLERAGRFILQRLFREALDELVEARRLEPRNPDVLLNLGSVLAQLDDSTRALAVLAEAAEVAPGDPLVLFNLGLLQWRLGRQADARATWERLFAVAPESDLAHRVRELVAGRAR